MEEFSLQSHRYVHKCLKYVSDLVVTRSKDLHYQENQCVLQFFWLRLGGSSHCRWVIIFACNLVLSWLAFMGTETGLSARCFFSPSAIFCSSCDFPSLVILLCALCSVT